MDCKCNIKKIPKHDLEYFARATLSATERYFALTGVRQEYEKWLRKRNEKG